MNIQQLEYIIAVDEFKSFSGAAAHCYVTQASLSAMVKKLEVELDTVLFDRRSKIVITTEAGIQLIAEAKQIVQHTQLLLDKAKKISKTISGQLKIGMITTIANSLYPLIFAESSERFPELNIQVNILTAEDIVKQMKEGDLDMGILETSVLPPELGQVILYQEALLAYGNKESNNVFVYDEGQHSIAQFCQLFKSNDKKVTSISLLSEAKHFNLLLTEVDEHGGSTILPELCYQLLTDERKEQVRLFGTPSPVREISIVFHKKYTNANVTRALSDLIRGRINRTLKASNFTIYDLDILAV